ncbi:FlgO family outer membrane protein [Corallincola platygyrae]|uniref:FlgO family outer membrane protein n=1 Tax=Corallincola platygyrae TaxID=1193278 RepID=A0ABW4XIK5_9GAMM
MKSNYWQLAATVFILTACASEPEQPEHSMASGQMATSEAIAWDPYQEVKPKDFVAHVEKIAEELVGTMPERCYQPMAVASFVDIETLNTSGSLGKALAENLITQMQQQGCKVLDFKLKDKIQVTSTGDFVFSRNFTQLKSELPLKYVLTGTLQPMNGGVQVNARLVDIKSKVVVGAAQQFLPEEIVSAVNEVKTRDGVTLLSQRQG